MQSPTCALRLVDHRSSAKSRPQLAKQTEVFGGDCTVYSCAGEAGNTVIDAHSSSTDLNEMVTECNITDICQQDVGLESVSGNDMSVSSVNLHSNINVKSRTIALSASVNGFHASPDECDNSEAKSRNCRDVGGLARSASLDTDQYSESLYTDKPGKCLRTFFTEQLNKGAVNRDILLNVERILTEYVESNSSEPCKFTYEASFHRLLVHRCCAFFGLEHNVDMTKPSKTTIIVTRTKLTRIPSFKFADHITNHFIDDEPKKMVLKRDPNSAEEPSRLFTGHKSKSYEERELEYNEARSRIFKTDVSAAARCDGVMKVVRLAVRRSSSLPGDMVDGNDVSSSCTETVATSVAEMTSDVDSNIAVHIGCQQEASVIDVCHSMSDLSVVMLTSSVSADVKNIPTVVDTTCQSSVIRQTLPSRQQNSAKQPAVAPYPIKLGPEYLCPSPQQQMVTAPMPQSSSLPTWIAPVVPVGPAVNAPVIQEKWFGQNNVSPENVAFSRLYVSGPPMVPSAQPSFSLPPNYSAIPQHQQFVIPANQQMISGVQPVTHLTLPPNQSYVLTGPPQIMANQQLVAPVSGHQTPLPAPNQFIVAMSVSQQQYYNQQYLTPQFACSQQLAANVINQPLFATTSQPYLMQPCLTSPPPSLSANQLYCNQSGQNAIPRASNTYMLHPVLSSQLAQLPANQIQSVPGPITVQQLVPASRFSPPFLMCLQNSASSPVGPSSVPASHLLASASVTEMVHPPPPLHHASGTQSKSDSCVLRSHATTSTVTIVHPSPAVDDIQVPGRAPQLVYPSSVSKQRNSMGRPVHRLPYAGLHQSFSPRFPHPHVSSFRHTGNTR